MPEPLAQLIADLGRKLGFDVGLEVPASSAAWIDVVWFDQRLSPTAFGAKTSTIRQAPILPVIGFEVELSTGANAKHIKGSVSNLNNLGAQLGVIVIGRAAVAALKAKTKTLASAPDSRAEKILMERVYKWVYAESHPSGRLVIMSEPEVIAWAARHGVSLSGGAA